MGVNYYVENVRATYPYDPHRLHIGNSMLGWAFALHLVPKQQIWTFDDWKRFYSQPHMIIRSDVRLKDGTFQVLHPDEMTQIITGRNFWNYKMDPEMLAPLRAWYDVEHGLLRAKQMRKSLNFIGDPRCVSSDPLVTYDVFLGDFS